ncbi:integrase catalytic domain-containing protein [Trichonephila clavipes]|nr:integrase catalytic domain-containing protein [Trichonephila clavipes]
MVHLAKSGFGTPIRKRDSPTEGVKPTELMTASALANSEKSSETEIGLLIGADNIGKLLTGNLIEVDSGLTAIETKLGWTVIGKVCSNGKVLDREVLSSFCKGCDSYKGVKFGIKYNKNGKERIRFHVEKIILALLVRWRLAGMLRIFNRSEKLHNLKYSNYIGDGDTKTINALSENKPYGDDYLIQKIECVGHVQKRMGRLTDSLIDKLAHYYGNAIRCNSTSVKEMRKAIWAVWGHSCSTDDEPIHWFCPTNPNTWCKYNAANNNLQNYKHKPSVAKAVQDVIKPVFADLSHPALLKKCLGGVNLIELIPDILDRFRIYPVGIVADIEKAFLMLSVAPKDRDYLRFFSPCNDKQLVYRHCQVVFGVSSSPYLLNASIMHLLENSNSECKEVAQKLKSSFYVDNCVTGVFSADEIEIFIEKTKLIMSEGCFNLRIFESNVASKSVDKYSSETFILGIIWDLNNDVLKCCTNFDSLTCEVKITKRLVLSTVQKVFDPIGMLAPSTLLPKLLLQEIWKMEKAWDQELTQNIVNKFMKWFNEIQILKDVTVPRCMKIDIFIELHVFVDASKGSYAGCVFARSIVDSRVNVILVRAKSRVAPLKLLNIPRLELMACCVGVRLVNSILKALNMPDMKVTLWSDSTTALWWIKEYGNWSVFVANRVKEIRQLTQIQSWKYVPGNMNIVDLLSRGCSPRQMLNSRWWEGPSWLKQNSEYWPDGEISCEPQEVNVERKKTKNANVDLANDAPPCLYVMCLIMIK